MNLAYLKGIETVAVLKVEARRSDEGTSCYRGYLGKLVMKTTDEIFQGQENVVYRWQGVL